MATKHVLAKTLVWARLIGVLSMFVITLIMLSMTGGIGWLVFSRDSADFKTIFSPDVYNSDWFKPMCNNKCSEATSSIVYGPNSTGNTDLLRPDTTDEQYSEYYGCSFKKKWNCQNRRKEECRDLSKLIPQFWFDDPSDVTFMQNSSHMCLAGLYLPYSPFSMWQDCLIYNIEKNPETRIAIMWRANWVFFAALCIAVIIEIVYVKHLNTTRKDFYRHGRHLGRRVMGGVYHLFLGILAVMLGGLTIETQAYFRDEMTPDMIDSLTDQNGNTYEPYNERLECYNSDTAMLIWNAALTLHKAGREKSFDVQYVSEYSVVYVSFLLGFGIIFICTVPLLWVSDEDEDKYDPRGSYESYGRRRPERRDRIYIDQKGWYERIDYEEDEPDRNSEEAEAPPEYVEERDEEEEKYQSVYGNPSAPPRPERQFLDEKNKEASTAVAIKSIFF